MKLGSFFDGIGGFPLAGQRNGIEPVWASEIEPFPIRVTTQRFPNMKHVGDITLLNGAELAPVDVVCGGSPCQDMSVAGKRKGMKHEDLGDEETTRSGLLMEQIRVTKEMRDASLRNSGRSDSEDNVRDNALSASERARRRDNAVRSDSEGRCDADIRNNERADAESQFRSNAMLEGERQREWYAINCDKRGQDECAGADKLIRPRFMVWENVHGALSSNKGEDFRIVLEETARIADRNAVIPRPPKGKWKSAGCIVGDGWSIAWRVFDAQFWGVHQRRSRVILIADFGGQSAPEILFKREGLCRDIEESKRAREAVASAIGSRAALPDIPDNSEYED